MASPGEIRSFAAAGETAAFDAALAAAPRALVLYQGTHCPYSATFRPHFQAASARPGNAGLAFLVRLLSEAHDAGWTQRQVRVTPTVVAYVAGRETSRLEGRLLLGITRQGFERWLRALPPP